MKNDRPARQIWQNPGWGASETKCSPSFYSNDLRRNPGWTIPGFDQPNLARSGFRSHQNCGGPNSKSYSFSCQYNPDQPATTSCQAYHITTTSSFIPSQKMRIGPQTLLATSLVLLLFCGRTHATADDEKDDTSSSGSNLRKTPPASLLQDDHRDELLPEPKIINGENARRGRFEYMVRLTGPYLCGG